MEQGKEVPLSCRPPITAGTALSHRDALLSLHVLVLSMLIHRWLTSQSWLKAFVGNTWGTVYTFLFGTRFIFLTVLRVWTFRAVHRQACRTAPAPSAWSDPCWLHGACFQRVGVQPAGRFIPRMLKLMLKQTTCFLERQLKGIRK